MMRFLKIITALLFLFGYGSIYAQVGAITGFCVKGATPAVTSGSSSTNTLQGIIPQCKVTAHLTGTTTLVSIYSNSQQTTLTNPFTATATGQWIFYVASTACYDITLSGGFPPNVYTSPVTITDVCPSFNGGSTSISLTTNGTSGPSTFDNGVLNVPIYNGIDSIVRIPNAKINQSFGTTVNVIGNSICTGTGATSTATSWVNVFYSKIGVGTLNEHCIAGALIADTLNFGLLNIDTDPLLDLSYNKQPFSSGLTIIYDSDNETGNTTSAWETAYQQTYMAAIVLAGSSSASWITPYNTGVSTSGTIVQDNFAQPLPSIESTTVGGTISYSGFITDGAPIYLVYPIFSPGDGGSFTVSIDGNVATDTITNSSTLANTPFGGTIILTAFGFTQTFAAARFPVGAGSHDVKITTVVPGIHGNGLAVLATVPANSTEWSLPTVAVAGTIHQLGDANATGTAAFNSINQAMVNLTAADGFNTVFGDVRGYIPLSLNTPAMSATDGFGPGAIVRTDITATAGTDVITGAAPFSLLYAPTSNAAMLAFCPNGGAGGTAFHGKIAQFSTLTPNSLILSGNLGVSGTITCWFGWPGQVFPASTDPGLHPNDFGHQLIARAFLGAFQPVTVPQQFNAYTTFNAGADINCSGAVDCILGLLPTPSSPTSPIGRIDILGSTGGPADGIVLPFYAPDNNVALGLATESIGSSTVIGYMSGATNQLQNYTFPFEFNGLRGFTSTLPIKGTQLVQTNGESLPSVGANVSPTLSFIATTINLPGNVNLYTPVGTSEQQVTFNFCQGATPHTVTPQIGVTSFTQPTAGSGQTPGSYTVPGVGGGGTGAALTMVIGSAGTLTNALVQSFGTGYTSGPVFTNTAAGGTPSTSTGIISAPIVGFYFQNGGIVDQTPNACSSQSFRYVPSKSAWYADGFLPTVGTTVAASFCNQSGTLTGVAGCLVQTISGVTHFVPFF